MSGQDINAFKVAAAQIVEEFFETHKRGIHLSRLGQDLAKRGFALDVILGHRKLATFVDEELAGRIVTIRGNSSTIVLAAPAAPGADQSAQVVAEVNEVAFRSPVREARKYPPPLWAAFTNPLPVGMRRFVSLSPSIHFMDVQAGSVVPGAYELDEALIVSESASPETKGGVNSRIANWLNSIGFAEGEIPKKNRSTGSLLTQLLGALSEDQKRRVQLPLDVVAVLFKR